MNSIVVLVMVVFLNNGTHQGSMVEMPNMAICQESAQDLRTSAPAIPSIRGVFIECKEIQVPTNA